MGLFGYVRPTRGAVTSTAAKKAARQRSRDRCERCGVYPAREFHHVTYERHGNEFPSDLEHLCADCHRSVHFDANGTFWLFEDEKLAHWETYHTAMEKD
jgi:hypothetical protein